MYLLFCDDDIILLSTSLYVDNFKLFDHFDIE